MLEMRIARALHVLAMGAGAFISFQGVARAETKPAKHWTGSSLMPWFWRCEAPAIISPLDSPPPKETHPDHPESEILTQSPELEGNLWKILPRS